MKTNIYYYHVENYLDPPDIAEGVVIHDEETVEFSIRTNGGKWIDYDSKYCHLESWADEYGFNFVAKETEIDWDAIA